MGGVAGLGAVAMTAVLIAVLHPSWLVGAHPLLFAGAVALGGAVPGALIGMFLARIGHSLAEAPAWLRIATLAPPAFAATIVLAFAADAPRLAAIALIPALASVLSVERRTRAEAQVPVAVAR